MPKSRTNSSSSNSRRSKTLKKKKVRIYSPNNQVKTYDLDSDEKKSKRSTSAVGRPCTSGVFPCVYRGVEFENKGEWDEYKANSITRNRGVSYNHKRNVITSLFREGKLARKIPPEWRLYNIQTGEIIDLRKLT